MSKYRISKEDIQEQIDSIKIERQKLKEYIHLFNPDWSVVFPKNSFVLITAASGVGKTTFIRQCVKECIRDEKKVLLFSNEELKSNILQQLVDSFLLEFDTMSEDEIIERILTYCYVIDLDDSEDLEYYDRVPSLIMTAIEDFEPDVVFFDQISYCKFATDKKKRNPYEYLADMVNEFKPYINSEELRPPIVLVQQGRSLPGVAAGDSNKDATNTVNAMTHVIQIFREGESTYLEVQKYRNRGTRPYKRYTKFSYDDYYDLFEFEKAMDDYESSKHKRKGAF